MIKTVVVLIIMSLSFSALAEDIFLNSKYSCNPATATEINVGEIIIYGDVTKKSYSIVALDSKVMAWIYGQSKDYIYLTEDLITYERSYLLEIVNYPVRSDKFRLWVNPKRQIAADSRLSRYECVKVKDIFGRNI